jgi:WD40 repeat protein
MFQKGTLLAPWSCWIDSNSSTVLLVCNAHRHERATGFGGYSDRAWLVIQWCKCVAGHKNVETVKGVSFLGSDEEFVASGSDCGHLFVWSKRDGLLRCMQTGDTRILNCVAAHPTQPLTLATSGAPRGSN